jgi:hypothetical protein
MVTKKVAAIAAAAVLAVGLGAYGMASAYGGGHGHWHGHGHGGGFFLLAHAAGISSSTIRSTFQGGGTQLQGYRAKVKADRQALITCLLSTPTNCTGVVTQYLTDKQAAESYKLSVWETLFAGASPTGLTNAQTLLSDLQKLQTERKQDFQQVFGGAAASDAPTTANQ